MIAQVVKEVDGPPPEGIPKKSSETQHRMYFIKGIVRLESELEGEFTDLSTFPVSETNKCLRTEHFYECGDA